jgi:hypothetical protein
MHICDCTRCFLPQGFIKPQHNRIIVSSDPEDLIRQMQEFTRELWSCTRDLVHAVTRNKPCQVLLIHAVAVAASLHDLSACVASQRGCR